MTLDTKTSSNFLEATIFSVKEDPQTQENGSNYKNIAVATTTPAGSVSCPLAMIW